MTTSSELNKARFVGNGSTTVFPASIKIFNDTDITVQTITRSTNAVANTLVLNDAGSLGYTLSFDTDAETLTVTTVTAPLSTQDLFILRSVPVTQTTDFPVATKFPSVSVENALDKAFISIQDQIEKTDRALVFPASSTFSGKTVADPETGLFLTWDASGNVANTDIASLSLSGLDIVLTSLTTGDILEYDGTNWVNTTSSSSNLSLVSADDTTAGYLNGKLTAGNGVSFTENSGGANETLDIACDYASQAEAEAGTATDKPLNSLRVKQAIDANPSITLGTSQATTSGTAIDFTSIPAGTKRIDINFSNVSLNSNNDILVQIGDSGGIETTGYVSATGFLVSGSQGTANSTSGFIIYSSGATSEIFGTLTLSLVDAATFKWVASGTFVRDGTAAVMTGGGKTLSAELDRIRITRSGSDTFDLGEVNISYS